MQFALRFNMVAFHFRFVEDILIGAVSEEGCQTVYFDGIVIRDSFIQYVTRIV